MSVLVTGATGFVGSVITRQLVGRGDEVAILRRRSSRLDLLEDVAGRVEHRIGDVTDPESLDVAFAGIRRVYHAAAYVGIGGRSDLDRLHAVNVDGTGHVVNAALRHGVERLVHTSSIAALGRPEQPSGAAIDETAEWLASKQNTAYARSKRAAELEVHRGIAEGLDAVLVNPALIFGIGRPGENTRALVDKIRRRRLPAIPAGGTCVVDVIDVARGHLLAMERGVAGERYVLGGDNLSWEAIIRTLAEAFDVRPPRFRLPPGLALTLGALSEALAFVTRRPALITRETARISARTHRYDHRKAVEELGCAFRPFDQTARRLARVLTASYPDRQ